MIYSASQELASQRDEELAARARSPRASSPARQGVSSPRHRRDRGSLIARARELISRP